MQTQMSPFSKEKEMKSSLTKITRMKHVSIPLALEVLIFTVYLIREGYLYSIHGDPLWVLHRSQSFHLLIAIIHLYTSFEISYDCHNCGLEECVSTNTHGRLRLLLEPLLVQLIYLLLFYVLMVIVPICVGISAKMPFAFHLHVLSVNVLNTLIGGTIFILTGTVFGLSMSRMKAYTVMAIMIFFTSPFSNTIPGVLNDAFGINAWPAKSFFSLILPPNTTWTIDYQYGISCEPMRFNLLGFWLCLVSTAFVWFLLRRTVSIRRITAGAGSLLAFINLAMFLPGGSIIDLTEAPSSVFRSDQTYYRHSKQIEEEAPFSILAYDMDLRVDRKLHGRVSMELDSANTENEYPFTLCRYYKISKVTDEANTEIPFDRQGDYFVVHPSRPIHTVVVYYSGYSPMFYSNEQAVCLPGCFPYYPWAGYRKLHYLEPDDKVGLVSNIMRVDLQEADYSVRISGVKNLVTNLSMQNGAYSGTANGLSVLGGFIEQTSIGAYSAVVDTLSESQYRFTAQWLDDLQEAITTEENRRGSTDHIDLSDYLIIQSNETLENRAGYGAVIVMSDHIFLQSGICVELLAEEIVSQKIDPLILSGKEFLAKMEREANRQ